MKTFYLEGNLVKLDRLNKSLIAKVKSSATGEIDLVLFSSDVSFIKPILLDHVALSEADSTPSLDEQTLKKHKITIIIE